jgi:DNA-binding winged helix-turn-helix (wHTH) protein/Flp pilus assembly protein TadD
MSIKTPTHLLTLDEAGQPQAAGRPLKLPPKERAVLRLLLAHAPRAVRKDEFAHQAWAGGEMSDESLARCISRVRRVLQPHGLKVEAVYGLGYRLVEQTPQQARDTGPTAQAHDSYAHARQLMQQRTPTAMGMAVELLRALVRSEPAFAAARVALADALAVAVGWGQLPTPAAVEEGLAALSGLDAGGAGVPGLHAARGALLDMAWRFGEARHCFDRALAVDGDSTDTLLAHARHLLYTDEAGQAVEQLRRVRQLAPHALHVRMTLTRALVQSGRGAEAVAEAQATVIDHPGQLVTVAFSLAIQAMVAPHPELAAAALRLTQGLDTPPFVWTVASFVLSRLGRREAALDIVDTALLCSRTTAGEATLYAAPLAALGELDRAAALLRAAVDERCGMMAMVLRDPAHAHWLPHHAAGRALLNDVFGGGG